MNSKKILLAAALLSLGIASCQKDERAITHFTAGIERPSAKTHADDGSTLKWDSQDRVKVYGSDPGTGVTFIATPCEGNDAMADLYAESGASVTGTTFCAIHPEGIALSATSVALPAEQESADGSLANFPMYAKTRSNAFSFKNLCGVLKIRLANVSCTISRIEVKVAEGSIINGTYNVVEDGDSYELQYAGDGTNITTLRLTTPVTLTGQGEHDFYMYLPENAAGYQGMEITFYQPNGACCTKAAPASTGIVVERSKYTPISFTSGFAFLKPDLLPGIFSVSGSKWVRFAKGNLVANSHGNTPNATNTTWSFHENQYDRLGSSNDIKNQCELFGYSTSNTYYGLNASTSSTLYSGGTNTFVDWGNAVGNDLGTGWSTLSFGEWDYLLNTRSQAMRYLMVTLFSDSYGPIYGLMIFPDNFSWPTDAGTAPASNSFNKNIGAGHGMTDNSSYADQENVWDIYAYNCDADKFAVLEQAGCVFFPATSFRNGESGTGDGGHYCGGSIQVNSNGHTYTGPYHVHIDVINGVSWNSNSGHYGRPVRLVQTVPNNQR